MMIITNLDYTHFIGILNENIDSVAKLVIDFSHPWLKSTCKRDKHASGGPGRPVSVDS